MNKQLQELTDRFLKAMQVIIHRNKLSGGKAYAIGRFANTLGMTQQAFHKYSTGERVATTPMILKMYAIHKVNPNYIVLGRGEMFLSEDVDGKIQDIHTEVEALKERVDRLEKIFKK